MTENDHKLDDPGDTRFFLRQNGWNRFSMQDVAGEFWFQKLTKDGNTVQAIIELTPGGRRKFYVEDPPEVFREAAHDGSCLTTRGIADGESIYRVHFDRQPDSIADGVRLLQEMLTEGFC